MRTSVLQGHRHASSREESANVVADSQFCIAQAGFVDILLVENGPAVVTAVGGHCDLMLSIQLEYSQLCIAQAGFVDILIVENGPAVVIVVGVRCDLMLSIQLEFSCVPVELVVAHLAINSDRLCVQLRIR